MNKIKLIDFVAKQFVTTSRSFHISPLILKAMATYEEVKDIPNHPEKYLIDVRNKDELAKTGVIPGSINIPLPELDGALKKAANDFKTAYNHDKPNEDSVVIFTCMSGARAQRATDLAQSVGFKNVKPYKGSWTEWAEKEGLNK